MDFDINVRGLCFKMYKTWKRFTDMAWQFNSRTDHKQTMTTATDIVKGTRAGWPTNDRHRECNTGGKRVKVSFGDLFHPPHQHAYNFAAETRKKKLQSPFG